VLRATRVIAAGAWDGEPADRVVLEFDDRHRRRIHMSGEGGLSFLLDLASAVALRSGDGLVLEDGRLVEVVGAAEDLCEIAATDAAHFLRLAWHLGNRHLPVQVGDGSLRIRRDRVIEEMVAGLGGRMRAVKAPFDPETRAIHGAHDHNGHAAHRHD